MSNDSTRNTPREFALIERIRARAGAARDDVLLGIGDDAAMVNCEHALASAAATLDGADILADAAALRRCVARACDALDVPARWMTSSLSLPHADDALVDHIAGTLHTALSERGVALIGGDTTRGPARLVLVANAERAGPDDP